MNGVTRFLSVLACFVLFGTESAFAQSRTYDLSCTAPQGLSVNLQVEYYDPIIIPVPIYDPFGNYTGSIDVTIDRWTTETWTGPTQLTATFTTVNMPTMPPMLPGPPVQFYTGHKLVFTGPASRFYRFAGNYYDNTGTLRTANVIGIPRP